MILDAITGATTRQEMRLGRDRVYLRHPFGRFAVPLFVPGAMHLRAVFSCRSGFAREILLTPNRVPYDGGHMSTHTSSPLTVADSPRPTAWSCILFDLDGTIVDSAPGIVERLGQTLISLGLDPQTPEELMRWVGPPLLDSFRDYAGLDEAGAWEGLLRYRQFVADVGPADNSTVYPGMISLLRDIRAAGIPVSLATSKPEYQAVTILEHFGITDEFTVICGASEDETRSSKADVIEEALRRLRALDVNLERPIMVGDRHHDIDGAAAHDIRTYLVSWGYAQPGEESGALAVIDNDRELRSVLLP